MKRIFIFVTSILFSNLLSAQENIGIAIKTNVLNLVAKRPSISIEKSIFKTYSVELSYTSGEFKNIPFRDYYKYNGFLLRAKKYFYPIEKGEINPFYGVYIGNLNKTVLSHNTVDNTGFVSIGKDNDFKANSIRYGGTLGLLIIPNQHFLFEGLTGIGYGNYFNIKNNISIAPPNGYFDIQLWLSIGYRF